MFFHIHANPANPLISIYHISFARIIKSNRVFGCSRRLSFRGILPDAGMPLIKKQSNHAAFVAQSAARAGFRV